MAVAFNGSDRQEGKCVTGGDIVNVALQKIVAPGTIGAAVPVHGLPSTTQRMRMDFNSLFKVPGNKFFRIGALIYGLVFCNVGALILYEKYSHPPVVYDANFRAGVGCLILGLIGLALARLSQKQSK